MELVRRFSDVLMIVLILINTGLHGTPVGKSLVNEDLNGVELIKMGNALNKPLLTLLGETFVQMEYSIDKQLSEKIDNVETDLKSEIKNVTSDALTERQVLKTELCKQKLCTEWTEWSRCSATRIMTFGASTRTRTCGGSSGICPTNVAEKIQTDSRICQGTECKSNKYTATRNNFCIRLGKTVKKSWASAQQECQQDGGTLINIDSELKAAIVNETLQKISFINDIWIDGKRTLPNGEWKYESIPEDKTFSNWDSGEPAKTDDCKAYIFAASYWGWRGRKCESSYFFLCEIVKSKPYS